VYDILMNKNNFD